VAWGRCAQGGMPRGALCVAMPRCHDKGEVDGEPPVEGVLELVLDVRPAHGDDAPTHKGGPGERSVIGANRGERGPSTSSPL